ncbi:SDR family NAD(P)-dependent oxidoreductase [Pyxidicoccus sp. 3LFB2]
MKTQPFKGPGVLITRASGAIGRVAANQDAASGADQLPAARRLAQAESAAREVMSPGVRALTVRCDVTRGEGVDHLMREAAKDA